MTRLHALSPRRVCETMTSAPASGAFGGHRTSFLHAPASARSPAEEAFAVQQSISWPRLMLATALQQKLLVAICGQRQSCPLDSVARGNDGDHKCLIQSVLLNKCPSNSLSTVIRAASDQTVSLQLLIIEGEWQSLLLTGTGKGTSMLTDHFRDPMTLDRIQSTAAAPYLDDFADALTGLCNSEGGK